MDKHKHADLSAVSGDALMLCVAVLSGILPFVLFFSVEWFFTWDSQQPSMSSYIYTSARPLFYGIVFTLGVVLLFYRGYPENSGPIPLSDNRLASIAGIAAISTAIFPTDFCSQVGGEPFNYFHNQIWSIVHFLSAGVSYLCIALFLLFYFTQTGGLPPERLPPYKSTCNRIYRVCGYLVIFGLAFLTMATIYRILTVSESCDIANQLGFVFWTELVMQVAIAVGWGTKFIGRRYL